jgi:hypothetical protein
MPRKSSQTEGGGIKPSCPGLFVDARFRLNRCLPLALSLSVLFAATLVANAVQEQAKPAPITASARLAAAHTAFVRNAGGSAVAYNAIYSALEGWGRFGLLDSPAKADIIIEVVSPGESGGVSVNSSTSGTTTTQTESRDLQVSGSEIRLTVLDSHSKVALWSATQKAKSALKQKDRKDRMVEAADRLVSDFRKRIEENQQGTP